MNPNCPYVQHYGYCMNPNCPYCHRRRRRRRWGWGLGSRLHRWGGGRGGGRGWGRRWCPYRRRWVTGPGPRFYARHQQRPKLVGFGFGFLFGMPPGMYASRAPRPRPWWEPNPRDANRLAWRQQVRFARRDPWSATARVPGDETPWVETGDLEDYQETALSGYDDYEAVPQRRITLGRLDEDGRLRVRWGRNGLASFQQEEPSAGALDPLAAAYSLASQIQHAIGRGASRDATKRNTGWPGVQIGGPGRKWARDTATQKAAEQGLGAAYLKRFGALGSVLVFSPPDRLQAFREWVADHGGKILHDPAVTAAAAVGALGPWYSPYGGSGYYPWPGPQQYNPYAPWRQPGYGFTGLGIAQWGMPAMGARMDANPSALMSRGAPLYPGGPYVGAMDDAGVRRRGAPRMLTGEVAFEPVTAGAVPLLT